MVELETLLALKQREIDALAAERDHSVERWWLVASAARTYGALIVSRTDDLVKRAKLPIEARPSVRAGQITWAFSPPRNVLKDSAATRIKINPNKKFGIANAKTDTPIKKRSNTDPRCTAANAPIGIPMAIARNKAVIPSCKV